MNRITIDLSKEIETSNQKRWHLALATIYCSRAFKTAYSHGSPAYSPKKVLSVSTDTIAIDVSQQHPFFSNINYSTKLVKDKNIDELANLGGVQGVAVSLKSDTTNGVRGDPEDVARKHEAFGSNMYRKHLLRVSLFLFGNHSNIPPSLGMCQHISTFEIVVGDVICLKIGDQVPADGILVKGHSLQVDESSMTGESDHVQINLGQNPFLISGTKVVDSYVMMLVTLVDMNTTWVALLVLVVQLVKYFIGTTKDENGNKEFNGSKTSSVDVINVVAGSVANVVIIVVVTIPEGLPLVVALTLAYLMKRMMDDKAIVRKLSACETVGFATTICIHKIGTFTLIKMIVTKFFLGKGHIKKESHTSISAKVLELFQQGVGLNTTCSVFKSSDLCSSFEFLGSPTEKAILS
ncbi:hypothetical protein H5410_048502 [Solanum commersonii]|uniref:P-type ATPase A domain-containing protein n=1 Tax=Solanum commersonii TaxID=4109 RepID=A0A9J5XL95_SOLCO|nr:hypothetical protein H5410_048502 [Solanum commersonii]